MNQASSHWLDFFAARGIKTIDLRIYLFAQIFARNSDIHSLWRNTLFRLSLFLRLLKKCNIYALDTKWPILGGFRIRVGYPIISYFFKKRPSSCNCLSLFVQRFKKTYYSRPRYEMADFRWFLFKGRLPNYFRLFKKHVISLVFS